LLPVATFEKKDLVNGYIKDKDALASLANLGWCQVRKKKMKTINTEDAVGTILCHDLTRIVRDEVKETAFRKGHRVQPEDIAVLLSMGKNRLYVWEDGPDILHENEAALALLEVCSVKGFTFTDAKEGRINLLAESDGLFLVDLDLLEKVNDFDEIGVAVRQSGTEVKKGQIVAGFKIIPLALKKTVIEEIGRHLTRPLLEVRSFLPLKAGVVATGGEVYHGRIKDQFTPVVEEKLACFGIKTFWKTICDDDMSSIAQSVRFFFGPRRRVDYLHGRDERRSRRSDPWGHQGLRGRDYFLRSPGSPRGDVFGSLHR
jgi:DNA-binding transcriptional regulator YiaG